MNVNVLQDIKERIAVKVKLIIYIVEIIKIIAMMNLI